MRPAEKIENFIKNVPLETKSQRDKEVLDDALKALKETKTHTQRQPNIWKAIMKSRMTKLAAAAVIILAVLIGIGTFDRKSAWAEVLKAFSEVNQFYLKSTQIFPDGTEKYEEYWLRKPDGLREEHSQRIIIDNGKERLTLNKDNKEAQFEDSILEYRPVSDHYMFEHIGIFRGEEMEGLTVKQVKDQSDGTTSVFRLDYKNSFSQNTYQGKAWVDNQTMLPTRIKLQLLNKQKDDGAISFDEIFDYSPISDDVFGAVVPDGYTVLPRRRVQAISGKIVDDDGSPLQGATVHLTDKWLRFLRNVATDGEGEFVFELPPSEVHWVGLPLFLRAVPPDDLGRVAWTIVEDPAKKKDQGVAIPGQTGRVEMNGSLFIQSVSGIVLQMETAGTISGRITDMQGNPISGAEVKVEGRAYAARIQGMPLFPDFGFIGDPLGGDGPHGELTARTDEQGRYKVTNVPKLSERNWYKVVASAPRFSANEKRINTTWTSDVEQVDMQLYHAGITVSGTLVDNYGRALGMREIRAHIGDEAGGRIFCRTQTDEKGYFTLRDCPVSPRLQVRAILAQNTWLHLGKEKHSSYTYYPNVIVPLNYREGTMQYDVKMVAEKPEFTIELEVKNTQGKPVVHYPVELSGTSSTPSPEWQDHGRLTQRTDMEGRCKFTEAPNLEGLRLVVGRAHIFNDALSKEEAEKAKRENARYQWTIVPIDVKPGQKEYRIEVTLLTVEELKTKQ